VTFLIGIAIALSSILLSVFHLHQSVTAYFDDVAVFVVLGGTCAVSVITLPWELSNEVLRSLRGLFQLSPVSRKDTIRAAIDALAHYQQRGTTPDISVPGLAGDVLRDGFELISLGFETQSIQAILQTRIDEHAAAYERVANSVRSLSKYPPAFGLVGTVLGLVSLMRAISDGMSSQETGIRMAVALVSTLYGLLIANLLINPAGETILKNAIEDGKCGEIALQAIVLAAERNSILEAQELLNSYVGAKKRISIFDGAKEAA
jgi:chemotaxis protein MotA